MHPYFHLPEFLPSSHNSYSVTTKGAETLFPERTNSLYLAYPEPILPMFWSIDVFMNFRIELIRVLIAIYSLSQSVNSSEVELDFLNHIKYLPNNHLETAGNVDIVGILQTGLWAEVIVTMAEALPAA